MPPNRTTAHYPFTAVVGQETFKLALLLIAVNPLIGGVLICGPRGSAKSTLARGLPDLLTTAEKSPNFVTLPLGASEEMLIGTLNLQQVLDEQQFHFQPGLLARAHQGILYVDEVNLLPDNLVDQLLDVATSGVNTVERDGISQQHDAQFVLLGTMNPDEGELRPQLMDRFGLCVELSNQFDIAERIQIVESREAFDSNSVAFYDSYYSKQQALKTTIAQAQQMLQHVKMSPSCQKSIAERCHTAQVDGLRADIIWTRAAKAHAALNGQLNVCEEDLLAVEALVLTHRRKKSEDSPPPPSNPRSKNPFFRPDKKEKTSGSEGDWGAMEPQTQLTESIKSMTTIDQISEYWSLCDGYSKKRSSTVSFSSSNSDRNNKATNHPHQSTVISSAAGKSKSAIDSKKINWFSTWAHNRKIWPLSELKFYPKQCRHSIINLIVLDTSGSTLSQTSFAKAKGLIQLMAERAYHLRQQFALIGFGNGHVETLMGLRRSPKSLRPFLNQLKASGGTPLREAFQYTRNFQKKCIRRDKNLLFHNVVLTDGRVTELPDQPLIGNSVILDIEQSSVKRGRAKTLANHIQAHYLMAMT